MKVERAAAGSLTAEMARWSSWSLASAGVTGAILVNALTLGGIYFLLGHAVAIARATGIHAFVFCGVSRQQGEGCRICVARFQGSGPQWQKHSEDDGDAGKVSPAIFHGLAPLGRNTSREDQGNRSAINQEATTNAVPARSGASFGRQHLINP
jgi:hypothetical protein